MDTWIVRWAVSRSRRVSAAGRQPSCAAALALALLGAGSAPSALAIYSCQAGAGPSVSGGSADSCGLNKYQVSVTSTVVNAAGVSYFGNAAASLPKGTQSGGITIADTAADGFGPPAANGSFYSELLADFRIVGPASASPLPVSFVFAASGTIAGNCVDCEAFLGSSIRLQRPGLLLEVSGGRTRFTGWTSDTNAFGGSGVSQATGSGLAGKFVFDAAGLLNQPLRLTSNVSGGVAFTGPNPDGVTLSADASNTVLFNLLLPAGYSIVADPAVVPFLTTPVLTSPIPEPQAAALFSAGLFALVAVVGRRRRAAPA